MHHHKLEGRNWGLHSSWFKHYMAHVFTKVNHVCWRIMYLNGIDGRYD